MTTLIAAREPSHRMFTTRFGAAWIASCACGYIGLARSTAASAMAQGTEEHDRLWARRRQR